jgi:hypothetical protein
VLVALDQADQHGVDQDIVRRALAGQHLGEREPGGTRDRGRRAAAARRLGADVEHVDDAAPAPLLHLRPGEPSEPDRTEQLEIEILLHHLVGQRLERRRVRGAGIVDHDVDLAERLHRLVIGALDVGCIRHVCRDAGDLDLRLAAHGGDRGIERLAAACHHGDVGAGGGELHRHGEADALAAAGDDGRAAGE